MSWRTRILRELGYISDSREISGGLPIISAPYQPIEGMFEDRERKPVDGGSRQVELFQEGESGEDLEDVSWEVSHGFALQDEL
jgi:hypothetical protein